MRIGQNPAKFVESVPQPARVTVVLITYIPFLSGYYAQALEVLKACLESLWAHTQTDYDLLVFDNASCPEVRTYLQEAHTAGKIQYLVLSEENLGKAAAWNFVFGAAPGEVVAYADADIYFEAGWLDALLKVLDAFPQAGMVTGIPMWSPEQYSTATVRWAEAEPNVRLERGKLLSWEDYWKHAQSLGQDEATARSNFDAQEDVCLAYQGVRYHVGAGHFQFLARKSVLQEVIPVEADRPMGQVRRLDQAINARGYLRLSTPGWWVRHMGNTLPGDAAVDLPQAGDRKRKPLRGPVRRVVQWLYHQTFDLLYRR
jgi:hypothetical protein